MSGWGSYPWRDFVRLTENVSVIANKTRNIGYIHITRYSFRDTIPNLTYH